MEHRVKIYSSKKEITKQYFFDKILFNLKGFSPPYYVVLVMQE